MINIFFAVLAFLAAAAFAVTFGQSHYPAVTMAAIAGLVVAGVALLIGEWRGERRGE